MARCEAGDEARRWCLVGDHRDGDKSNRARHGNADDQPPCSLVATRAHESLWRLQAAADDKNERQKPDQHLFGEQSGRNAQPDANGVAAPARALSISRGNVERWKQKAQA